MSYAIIGAMNEEVKALLALASSSELIQKQPFPLYRATLSGADVLVCISGIGKVEAALTTTYLLSNYEVQAVVNIGSAGGLQLDQKEGDVVIATELKYHDLLFVPENPETGIEVYSFKTDTELNQHIRQILISSKIRYAEGLLVSGDQFVCRPHQWQAILNRYPEAIASEMEATAIAHVCSKFSVPFIVLRSLSDIVLKEGNEHSFDEFLPLAAAASARYCSALMQRLVETKKQ